MVRQKKEALYRKGCRGSTEWRHGPGRGGGRLSVSHLIGGGKVYLMLAEGQRMLRCSGAERVGREKKRKISFAIHPKAASRSAAVLPFLEMAVPAFVCSGVK